MEASDELAVNGLMMFNVFSALLIGSHECQLSQKERRNPNHG